MIKAVIFDFGGVLTEECWDSRFMGRAVYESLIEAGVNAGEGVIESFVEALNRSFERVLRTGIEERLEDIIRDFLLSLGVNPEPRIVEGAVRRINEAPFCKMRGEAPIVLRELKSMGLRIGLISNTPAEFPRLLLEKWGLIGFFDSVILSCDVGYRKPQPEIYLMALEELNARPEETLFVGDVLHIDIKGAKEVGMKTALMASGEPKMREWESYLEAVLGDPGPADFVLSSLTELLDVLRRLGARAG